MPPTSPGSAARAALRRLQQAGQALRQATDHPLSASLQSLHNVLASLATSAALRVRHCPAAYVLAWHEYLRGSRQSLPPRAIRYLCWEPEVATEARFHAYLDATLETLSTQALQGLVWCCHAHWSAAFAAGPVAQRVRQRLAAYGGDHGLLRHWSQHAEVLLEVTGPAAMATSLLAARSPIATFCNAWGVDPQTPYMLAVLRQALLACWQALESDASLCTYLLETLLPWNGWPERDFRRAVSNTVLHPVVDRTPGLPEQLMRLVLMDTRLGDPRLPARASHWQDVPQAVRQQCILWLSQADIVLFFDHVLPECKDQEERKSFWLRYVPRMVKTRPLLDEAVSERLRPLLARMPEQLPHCGVLRGSASALLIDFGAVVAVQVSDIEAPCYVYGQRNFAQLVPDFWRAQPFTEPELLVSRQAATVYHQQTWEKDIAEILALCEIRPTYKEQTWNLRSPGVLP
ncbi:MAG: EH signature domain-containing protein [Candidatus Tectimicrobiota bacterium]